MFLFSGHILKQVLLCEPYIDRHLDVNDTCKHLITNLKRHFVYGEIMQIHTIRKSNYIQ